MPFISDVEKRGVNEIEGAFKIAGKDVNLWVRVYQTEFGKKAKITVSYKEADGWKNTPALWIDRNLCLQLAEKLKRLAESMI